VEGGKVTGHRTYVISRALNGTAFGVWNGGRTAIICSTGHHINGQLVPRSKHTVSIIKTSHLMLFMDNDTATTEIYTKHINTLWAERRTAEC
jgi:hypothetical protein